MTTGAERRVRCLQRLRLPRAGTGPAGSSPRVSRRNRCYQHLDFGLPASETVRGSNFCSFKPPSLRHFVPAAPSKGTEDACHLWGRKSHLWGRKSRRGLRRNRDAFSLGGGCQSEFSFKLVGICKAFRVHPPPQKKWAKGLRCFRFKFS